MSPDKKQIVNGRKVEKYYWAGEYPVYVDNNLVTADFEETVASLEGGEEPRWARSGAGAEPDDKIEILSQPLMTEEGFVNNQNQRESQTLLPCPFCDAAAELGKAALEDHPRSQLVSSRDHFSTGYWVSCLGCGLKMGYSEAYDDCEGGDFATPQEAVSAWNTRAPNGGLSGAVGATPSR